MENAGRLTAFLDVWRIGLSRAIGVVAMGLRLALGVRRKGLSGASGLVTIDLSGISCSCSLLFGDAKGERKEDRKERGDFEGRTMAIIFSKLIEC